MALDDIKKAILAEAEKEAGVIEAEGKARIKNIQAEWAEKIEIKKQEIIASAQRKADQKIQQTQFKFSAQAQTEILSQKQKNIDKVYKTALQKLGELDDGGYVELMARLIGLLPKTDGEIFSVKDKEELLKKALRQSGRKYDLAKETVNGTGLPAGALAKAGGFIFKSKEVEINDTFAALVNNAKEQTILLVSNKLFNTQPEG